MQYSDHLGTGGCSVKFGTEFRYFPMTCTMIMRFTFRSDIHGYYTRFGGVVILSVRYSEVLLYFIMLHLAS